MREGTTERYEARISRAIALIDAELGSAPGLDRLAAAACLSPHHFHRLFKALTGETVHAFSTRLRLERAVVLAKAAPHLAWKEIGARVGYGSPPVFSRAFRRQFGVGPAAFDIETYWRTRPDAEAAAGLSDHFLQPAPPVPDDFMVTIETRPAARLAVTRATGGYLEPAKIMRAYERLAGWAEHEGHALGGGRLSGASRDDPDVTPLSCCRYEFRLEIAPGVTPPPGIAVAFQPEGRWAIHRAAGDMAAVDRAWNLLFKSWLPAAGLDLRDAPAEEVFVRVPAEIGWDRVDLMCCVPIV